MNISNSLTSLLQIHYPIIQAGMVWASGWRLASAVSNAGGLGILGAGSMKPELLAEHIQKCKAATNNPFAVNIPLLRGDVSELVETTINEGVKIVFSSAGNPATFIKTFKDAGITVVHVIPSVKHALKAQSVGCDAVVAEGFEAGGHNGPDMLTTLTLVPQVVDAVSIPVIAAGGIASGRQIAATLALGAQGVQIGTLFAASVESSAHENYKKAVVDSNDSGSVIALKKIGLVRMLKNEFALRAVDADERGASIDELREVLGKKRERLGIFEGDVNEGALEAGQSAGLVKSVLSVDDIFSTLIEEYNATIQQFRD